MRKKNPNTPRGFSSYWKEKEKQRIYYFKAERAVADDILKTE